MHNNKTPVPYLDFTTIVGPLTVMAIIITIGYYKVYFSDNKSSSVSNKTTKITLIILALSFMPSFIFFISFIFALKYAGVFRHLNEEDKNRDVLILQITLTILFMKKASCVINYLPSRAKVVVNEFYKDAHIGCDKVLYSSHNIPFFDQWHLNNVLNQALSSLIGGDKGPLRLMSILARRLPSGFTKRMRTI